MSIEGKFDRAKNIFRIYEADIRLKVKNTEPETMWVSAEKNEQNYKSESS